MFRKLLVNFILPEPTDSECENDRPDPEDPELNIIQRRVKKWALKKMAVQFNGYKKKLDNLFVKEKKTPDFNGPYEKIKDHWEEFVKYKTSERAKKRSATNKKNAANKMYFHTMGRGGYKAGRPKWEKWENDLIEKGIQPEVLKWNQRSRDWFYAHGGTLDAQGKCIYTRRHKENPLPIEAFRNVAKELAGDDADVDPHMAPRYPVDHIIESTPCQEHYSSMAKGIHCDSGWDGANKVSTEPAFSTDAAVSSASAVSSTMQPPREPSPSLCQPSPPPQPPLSLRAKKRSALAMSRNQSSKHRQEPLPRVPKVPPKRPYDYTKEENDKIAKEQYMKSKFGKKKPEPEPEPPISKEKKLKMLKYLHQPEPSLSSNYDRSIRKSNVVAKERWEKSKVEGKPVPQLGNQKNSCPPLQVYPDVLQCLDPTLVALYKDEADAADMSIPEYLSRIEFMHTDDVQIAY
ncbi:hypothetical protein QYE76_063455 [Lolium multiflorum]|uniref:Uncharacterized protein n=1 Tax=Lolium multiflorum TaxID=4521 RepID=A0AAD8W865_LOLMU|nr:hypothetical protein QYE76_063455 [Lolium multiflorum]